MSSESAAALGLATVALGAAALSRRRRPDTLPPGWSVALSELAARARHLGRPVPSSAWSPGLVVYDPSQGYFIGQRSRKGRFVGGHGPFLSAGDTAHALWARAGGRANRRGQAAIDFSRVAGALYLPDRGLDRQALIQQVAASVGVPAKFLTTMRDIYPGLREPEPGTPDVYGETVTLAPGVDRRSPEGKAWEKYTWTMYRQSRKGARNVEQETWYHLTDRARFKLDPKCTPRDNAISIADRSGRPGIYLAQNVEKWVNGHGYWRPFVVEFAVDPVVKEEPGVHGRWGGEIFIPASLFHRIAITRVIPLDAHARERFGQHGWIEGSIGREFDTGDLITAEPWEYPFKDLQYEGLDVRKMPRADVDRLKQQLRRVKK